MKTFAIIVHFCLLPSAFCLDWQDAHSVVQAALAASPVVREAEAQVAAARARERGAGTLPNPMLMSGVQNEPINLSTDQMTMYMIGGSQTFLRKDRRDALRRVAAAEVQRVVSEAESKRAEVARDAMVAWVEAAAAQSQIRAEEDIAKLASTMADAAKIRYETGNAAQIDIVRARLSANDVRHEVLMQRSVRDQALARLRAMLDLPSDASIPEFVIAHQHDSTAVALPLGSTPAIAALEAEVARADEEIALARLSTKPDINVEASYGIRPRQRDMISVVGRIELPVRKATIEPQIAEAMARRDAAKAQIEVLRQQTRSAYDSALAQRNAAREQIKLHVDELVPEAKLAFESALAAYQTGRTTFDSLLGALQTYRTLNVDYFDFVRQERIAETQMEAIRGGAR